MEPVLFDFPNPNLIPKSYFPKNLYALPIQSASVLRLLSYLDPRKRTFQVCFIAATTDPLRLRSTSTALTVAAPVRASDLQRDLTRSSDPHWEVQVRGSSSGCRPCHARHNSASGPGLPALLSGLAPGPPGRNVSVLLAADRRLSVQLCFVSKYTTRLVLVA